MKKDSYPSFIGRITALSAYTYLPHILVKAHLCELNRISFLSKITQDRKYVNILSNSSAMRFKKKITESLLAKFFLSL